MLFYPAIQSFHISIQGSQYRSTDIPLSHTPPIVSQASCSLNVIVSHSICIPYTCMLCVRPTGGSPIQCSTHSAIPPTPPVYFKGCRSRSHCHRLIEETAPLTLNRPIKDTQNGHNLTHNISFPADPFAGTALIKHAAQITAYCYHLNIIQSKWKCKTKWLK